MQYYNYGKRANICEIRLDCTFALSLHIAHVIVAVYFSHYAVLVKTVFALFCYTQHAISCICLLIHDVLYSYCPFFSCIVI